MEDITIIYYSSNREKQDLEERVKDNIVKYKGDLPIISVTQKPIDFGKNVCVGDVGVSGFNMFRQVLIACELATTKFILSAEADCLYPPDYFMFIPKKDNLCYRDSNLYVMGNKRSYFYLKSEGATHAQIVGRKFYIETLKKLFESAPEWSIEEKNFPKERFKKSDVFDSIIYYQTVNPVVQIKTSLSMRHHTHSDRTPVHDLPFWGNGQEFRKRYYETN